MVDTEEPESAGLQIEVYTSASISRDIVDERADAIIFRRNQHKCLVCEAYKPGDVDDPVTRRVDETARLLSVENAPETPEFMRLVAWYRRDLRYRRLQGAHNLPQTWILSVVRRHFRECPNVDRFMVWVDRTSARLEKDVRDLEADCLWRREGGLRRMDSAVNKDRLAIIQKLIDMHKGKEDIRNKRLLAAKKRLGRPGV